MQRLRELLRRGATATPPDLAEDERVDPKSSRDLDDFFRAAQRTLEHSHSLFDLTSGWVVREAEVEPVAAQRADLADRVAAAESAAAPFRGLDSEAATDLRGRVQRLRAQSESLAHASQGGRAELETTLQETEALIAALQREADATRSVAAQLIQEDAFNDLFNFGFNAPAPKPATPIAVPAGAGAALQSWLGRQVAHDEIDGLALFTDTGTFVAGTLPTRRRRPAPHRNRRRSRRLRSRGGHHPQRRDARTHFRLPSGWATAVPWCSSPTLRATRRGSGSRLPCLNS